MSSFNVVPLVNTLSPREPRQARGKVMLVKPPYFTPWTPPLGIAILKSFLERHGFHGKCFDFNIDPELWGMHHKYFATLQTLEDVSINDGYSKLWWILNAHMLAYANGANPSQCAKVLETIIPLYGIRPCRDTINTLIPLVDGFFARLGQLTDLADWSEFSVVGTSTYTTSLSSSLFILKRVKQKYPHVTTVMGGGVFADDLALGSDNLNTLIEQYPYVDHVVLGEGELLLLKLLQGEFANKKVISLSDLNGETLDMSDVPIPDFSDLSSEMYYHLSIEGARSCPFQCSFCSETIQWGEYRKKPIGLFAEQVIELAEKYGNNAFFMGDSLMNPYINPFASELINRKVNIQYDGYLRADKPVANRGFVKMWSQSGLFRVRLGIESAATRVLDAMDKMTTPQVISEVLKTLSSEGIRTTTYWIAGFPGETEADFQETCDFIREHHQYIYELEAHPYSYYPYGQVGSRLYESESLYPDEVTEIIKFQVWDIVDANPPRDERYDRLRRISQLATDLGLPNIYTMAQRYQAEERWHLLHPLAAQAYEGTGLERRQIRLPDVPLEAPSRNWKRREATHSNLGRVYCYQATINERLDEKVLSASMVKLIQNTDVLQMDLRDGKYLPISANQRLEEHGYVAVYTCKESEVEVEALAEEIIEELSSQMLADGGASIRAALINRNDQSCSLLLLVDTALVDAKSVSLLFEEMYRIYLQLSNEKPISVRPIKKTYTEFLKELQHKASGMRTDDIESSQNRDAEPFTRNDVDRIARLTTINIDESLTAWINSTVPASGDLSAREIIAAALVRSLAKATIKPAVDMTFDCRDSDADLEYTVGDLTTVEALSTSIFRDETLKKNLPDILTAPRRAGRGQSSRHSDHPDLNSGGSGQVLLNMEYFREKVWFDRPSWLAGGFVVKGSDLGGDYLLEVLPVVFESRIEVRLIFRDTADATELASAIAGHLTAEIEAILIDCDRFDSAKNYWVNEFSKKAPEIDIGMTGQPNSATYHLQDSVKCEVERAVSQDLSSQYGEDVCAVMLAAFSLMISRLSGSHDIDVVVSTDREGGMKVAPMRLHSVWDLKFRDLVGQVESKLAFGIEHEEFALDVLASHLPGSDKGFASPTFDIGFLFCSVRSDSNQSAMRDWLRQWAGTVKEFELILRVAEDSSGASLDLLYPSGQAEREVIERMGSYLGSILRDIATGPDTVIGDIGVTWQTAGYATAADANEAFDFDMR